LFAALIIIAGAFCNTNQLTAQSREAVDETAIILGETTPASPVGDSGSSVFVMLRMILVLALAALAIYGVVFFIKRLTKPRQIRDPHLKILARIPLSNDTYAAVLSVGAKAWLVGGGSGGVNLISEIDEIESLETMLIDDARKTAEEGAGPVLSFRALLERFKKAPNPPGSGDDQNVSNADSLRKQRERLKGL